MSVMTMQQARAAFRRRCNGEPEVRAAGFRTWARLSNLSGVGKLRRIVIGASK